MFGRTARRKRSDLRAAIDALPRELRMAMLDGLSNEPRIIAGAYTDGRGGICPMLAAHRRGERCHGAGFARAWDHFTGATRGHRPAQPEELQELRAMLLESVWADRPARVVAGDAWLLPERTYEGLRRALEVAGIEPAADFDPGAPDVIPDPVRRQATVAAAVAEAEQR